MGGTVSKELQLAKRLQDLCNEDGKEKEPLESAKVLHEFGLLYKHKSPDKICLIQSAAFLNAAVVRIPSNDEFQDDLEELHSHVLQVAGADLMETNLCKISKKASYVIRTMRSHTKENLKKLEIIPCGLAKEELKRLEGKHVNFIRKLQHEITEQYLKLMEYVGGESVRIMGNPPCKYSIAGLGSLARKEITPFSDFEHVIILEERVQHKDNYQEILEYFRWMSVIFHLIIINLKETIIRSVAIPWLNDDSIAGGDWFFDAHTTCGIKFDGMQLPACKIPLGRTRETDNKPFTVELIKPVSQMVKFLELEEDIKNGYHLADVLSNTCFVSGCKDVYESFQGEIKAQLSNEESRRKKEIAREINNYMEKFDVFKQANNLYDTSSCDVKRVLYRTSTLFISALGRLHSIDEFSCFDIIEAMYERSLITKAASHKLSYMISVSCTIRLNVYMMKNGQDDFYDNIPDNYLLYDAMGRLRGIVGEQSLGDYFIITATLQEAILNNLEAPLVWGDLEMKLSEKFLLLGALHLHDRSIVEFESYSRSGEPEPQEEDVEIRAGITIVYYLKKEFEKALELSSYLDHQMIRDQPRRARIMRNKSRCLYSLKRYKEATEYIAEARRRVKLLLLSPHERCKHLGDLALCDGECKNELELYSESISSSLEALVCYTGLVVPVDDYIVAKCLLNIGLCYLQLGKIDAAILFGNSSLRLYRKLRFQISEKYMCYALLGKCYFTFNQFRIALSYYKAALVLRLENVPPELQESDGHVIFFRSTVNELMDFIDKTGR